MFDPSIESCGEDLTCKSLILGFEPLVTDFFISNILDDVRKYGNGWTGSTDV